MKTPQPVPKNPAGRLTRRGLIMLGAQTSFLGVLALRLRHLQVTQSEEFRLLAEENRINIRLMPPARGNIFDRTGQIIAANRQNYRVVIVRERSGNPEDVLAKLATLIPLTAEDLDRARKEMQRRTAFVPVTIAEHLSWEDVAVISANAPVLPGIEAQSGLSRYYPLQDDFAHIVGYVGPVSDYDLARIDDQDPLLQIPKFQIGKSGVESKIERQLRGKAGLQRIEVNAVGRVMRELDRKEGIAGSDVQLTIDHGLQNFVQARLGEESAAAVVMNVRSGDLMAVGSSPSFDPNKFVTGISVADYEALTANEYRPLANKAVQGTYPPGSTFKMVVALAALEAGVIDTKQRVRCPGHYQLGERRYHCWRRSGHGSVHMHNALKFSCDVYFYDVARRVGIEKITEMARRLGLGTRYSLPMSAVARGLMPTKQWKVENRDESWLIGDTLNAGIGQGFLLASPLQLAVMAARIGSGTSVTPRLVKSVDGLETPYFAAEPLAISPTSLAAVQKGMFAVSNERNGTAYRTRIADSAMAMAGKTGTSQVRIITAEERRTGVVRNEDLPWDRRDHALFVAFAPFDDPEYAVSVIVEHGGGGSRAAAPIARDIVLQTLHGGLPPLSAYPSNQRRAIKKMRDSLPLRIAPTQSTSDRA